jgi:predicted dehydrogenase
MDKNKRTCKVAVIGLEHWYSAKLLLPAFERDPRVEIAGIAHTDLARARVFASQIGTSRIVSEAAELIEDSTIDAVAVFTSSDKNPGFCIAAARAGKDILAGKPIARTLEEATDVLTAVRETGVRLLPAETIIRWGPADIVRRWLLEGLLGEVIFARCSISAGLPQSWPDDTRPGWFVDPKRCAGGGWIDHAIYQIDRLRWVLGREVESIYGRVATARHGALEVEDWGAALARFDGGVLAELRADWYMPTTAMFQNQWELAGTKGAVRVDDVANRISVADVPLNDAPFNEWRDHPVPAVELGNSMAAHLADIVLGKVEPRATVEDAWRNLAVAAAFYEAANNGISTKVRRLP